jgi:hypothetical protein
LAKWLPFVIARIRGTGQEMTEEQATAAAILKRHHLEAGSTLAQEIAEAIRVERFPRLRFEREAQRLGEQVKILRATLQREREEHARELMLLRNRPIRLPNTPGLVPVAY